MNRLEHDPVGPAVILALLGKMWLLHFPAGCLAGSWQMSLLGKFEKRIRKFLACQSHEWLNFTSLYLSLSSPLIRIVLASQTLWAVFLP